jgi:hypothetical protein
VYYYGSDDTFLEICFQNPMIGAGKFTARLSPHFGGDTKKLYEIAPDLTKIKKMVREGGRLVC